MSDLGSPESSALEHDGELPDAPELSENGEIQQADVDHDVLPTEDAMDIESSPRHPVKQEVSLENLFDDDEEDDEFASSPPTVKAEEKMEDASKPTGPTAKYNDPQIMYAFYQRLFPFRYLFQWLNHSPSPSNDFSHREFAFTLQNDAYLRYQAFPTADLLRKDILRLNPSRFEIGPVYTTNPRDRKTLRKSSHFRPLAKELVFDIDLTDYDDIRTCCDKANICNKCWTFATMAIEVVDVALREDFGFKHILWVYSGRRGVHAWVCDKRAREMDDVKRRAVAGYLEVIKGGAQAGKKVNAKRPLHPHLSRSLDILRPYFQEAILDDQDPWRTTAGAEKLLALMPDQTLCASLRKKWDSSPNRSSASKWADIDALAKTGGGSRNLDGKALLEAKQDIVFEYTYARLDINVSKHLNHLLKSPFVVHPGTGRVCVPIDPTRLQQFDPFAVPTVTDLLEEIDAWKDPVGDADGSTTRLQDYEKTGLKPYVEYFRTFVMGLMRDEKAMNGGDGALVKKERGDEKLGSDAVEF